MAKFKIFRLVNGAEGRFMGGHMQNCIIKDGKASKKLYKDIYTCSRKHSDLEEIFHEFNQCIPRDFADYSLSVSDIVEMDGQPFFVDSVGFKKVQWEE